MRAGQQPEWETLIEVVSILNAENLPYMLTGSLAKTLYSTPRMTRDIDIVVELFSSGVDQIVRSFQKKFYIDQDAVQAAVETPGMFNIIHNNYQVKVDFIVRKNEEFRNLEFSRRKAFILQGIQTWVVSPEDLILSKMVWAKDSLSEMQLSDVRDMIRSVKGIDLAYIEKWVDNLGVRPIYEKVRHG